MTVEEKMILAIQVGEIALKNGELPVGAVIIKGNEIVGKAYSSGESSKIYLRHAEMKVLWEVDEKGYSVKERKKCSFLLHWSHVCYGGILREEGKTLLRKYIIAKKEGALVDFCNTLLNL